MAGPKPTAVDLTEQQRAELARLARRATGEQREVMRARIILAAADGERNDQIGRRFGVNAHRKVTRRDHRKMTHLRPLESVSNLGVGRVC